VLREGHVDPHDVVLRRADGTEAVLSVQGTTLHHTEDDSGGAALVVYRDVTAERAETERVADFASTVAHDLRSPLAAALGWLEVAQLVGHADQDQDQEPASSQLHALRSAHLALQRMRGLITDLLNQATAEGGRLDIERLALSGADGLLAEVVAGLGLTTSVTVHDLPEVQGDVEMIRQLFTNLVGNAAKYVAPGTAPRIEVRGIRHGSRVTIELRDNGIGIPERDRQRIFDRFYRAHRRDRHYSGTGLGLAICRAVVERHGGSIGCGPVEPAYAASGTRFRFDLPAADL
jgi:signal transduction histidine kinase